MTSHEWEERYDEVAAGAICPMRESGALVIAFRATSIARPAEGDLVLQSVSKSWRFATVHLA